MTDDFNDILRKEGPDAVRRKFDENRVVHLPSARGRKRPQPAIAQGEGGIQDAVALAFAKKHAETLRYVALWGKWLIFKGSHWSIEETHAAFDYARKLCREAGNAAAVTVAAVVKLASSDRALAATADQWDIDLMLLGTPGGTIDLRTGQLRAAVQTDYITKVTAVAPGGECPTWQFFLDRITAGDKELQQFLQRMCGYALTGTTKEDALFFGHGGGKNGKSVFVKTISGILNDYHTSAPMDMFTVTRFERHSAELADLRGARLVTAVETEEGKRWNEAKIKALTGGDSVKANFMRQDPFKYVPQFKLLMVGNHRPGLSSVDIAIRRRMNLIPFTVTIPESERDMDLPDKLKNEWPGILSWMVAGCLEWQRNGLRPPAAVSAATNEYLDAEDTLQSWISECCDTLPMFYETSAALWGSWKSWSERSGEKHRDIKWLANQLVGRGFERYRRDGERCYLGLKLKVIA